MLKRFFDLRGYQVLAEKDELKAIERLKVEKPAIVLTDIKIPSFSGMDLIKFIRQNMKDTPIIVMTAYPYLYPEKRNGNEVEAYFVKPFDILLTGFLAVHILSPQLGAVGFNKRVKPRVTVSAINLQFFSRRKYLSLIFIYI
jgi:CheY-like chemotaxis protein